MAEDRVEWRCVLSTGDSILLGLARSMLDKEAIRYVIEGEDSEAMAEPDGMDPEFNQGSGLMEVSTDGEHADRAVDLLKDLRMDSEA